MIVDAQVHPYAANTPAAPWAEPDGGLMVPPSATGDEMVAAMDAVGVDRAIAVSTWTMYRADTTFAEAVYREYPERFRLVAPIDVLAEGTAEQLERWVVTPGAVGIRVLFYEGYNLDPNHPAVVAAIDAATAARQAVNVVSWHCLPVMGDLARRFPDAQLILDHLGIAQPHRPPVPDDVLADLDQLLDLARYPNIAVKITGACTYSQRPFPFDDLWEPIGRVLDAFGVERCLWGTDWTRTLHLFTYDQAVSAFRDYWPLSDADRAALMGGTALRIYRWDDAP